jgi:hypothetical protein
VIKGAAHRETQFPLVNIEYDVVFNGLSESEINISADIILTEKWSKYKTTKRF